MSLRDIDEFLKYPFRSPLWNPIWPIKGDLLRPGINPMGYKYLGPGNPMDGANPINLLDRIAMQHDLAYEHAKSYEDVRRADDEFIKETGKISLFDTPMATAANVIMRGKRSLENQVGLLYPTLDRK